MRENRGHFVPLTARLHPRRPRDFHEGNSNYYSKIYTTEYVEHVPVTNVDQIMDKPCTAAERIAEAPEASVPTADCRAAAKCLQIHTMRAPVPVPQLG